MTNINLNVVFLVLFVILSGIGCSQKQEYHSLDAKNKFYVKINEDSSFLSSVTDLIEDNSGNVYINDPLEYTVHVCDKFGQFNKNIGTEGTGPGEFSLNSQVRFNNNQLYVYDYKLGRISIFNKNGLYLSSIKLKNQIEKFEVDSFGNLFIEISEYETKEGFTESVNKIIKIVKEGNKKILIDSVKIQDKYIRKTGNYFSVMPYRFSSKLCWGVLPNNNIISVRTGNYKVKIFNNNGKLLKENINIGINGKVIRKDIVNFYPTSIRLNTTAEMVLNSILTKKTKPIVNDMWISNVDIWVRTFNYEGESIIFDKLDLNGKIEKRYLINQEIGNGLIKIYGKNLYRYKQGHWESAEVSKYELFSN